jgi:hypothetical protein
VVLTEASPWLTEQRWFNATRFTCFWRVQAPPDHYIEVKLTGMDGFRCDQSCYHFLEVKHASKINSGISFICYYL